ncbi:MAG: MptD family putative ECF transporter S component [Lachnospiraceae bacterium]
MNDQKKTVGTPDKMKAKDFITLGIFTVLFFIVYMVCVFASAVTVVTYAFCSAIAAIPCGIIYMFMRVKITKTWSILLSGIVIGLLQFLCGAGWVVALSFILGALIAELISRTGQYKNFWKNAAGYALYMCAASVGTFLPMIMMIDYIDSMTASNGVEAAYMERVYNLVSGPMMIVIAIVTFIAGVLGALLAKALLKKHFQKAGII